MANTAVNVAVPRANRDAATQIWMTNMAKVVANTTAYGTTSERPTSPYITQQYFDTTLNQPIWWSGNAWVTGGATAAGVANSYFQSGYIQYTGANNSLQANINFILGTNIPNPSGNSGPALLLGSGSVGGNVASCWILTDQSYDDVTDGNMLGITAGETQGAGTANGGLLWLIAGGAFGGWGGTLLAQGGTSYNANGGLIIIQGGNATNGGKPGDAYISGGENGGQGASVHLIMTTLSNNSGTVHIRNNSDPVMDFYADGRIYLYKGGGFGTAGQSLKTNGATGAAYWG